MASIFKDSATGKWNIKYRVTMPDGTRKSKTKRGFRLKREAEEWFSANRSSIEKGSIAGDEDMTLTQWCELWIATYCCSLAPSTRVGYGISIRAFSSVIGQIKLSKLRPDHIQRTVNQLSTDIKPTTLANYFVIFKSCIRRAVHDGLLEKNVCEYIRLPKIKHEMPTFFTAKQIKTLFANIRNEPVEAPILLCTMLGLRRGEALGVKWDDVRGDELHVLRQVTVRSSVTDTVTTDILKTPASDRCIPIPKALKTALARIRRNQRTQRLRLGPLYHDDGFVCAEPDGGVISPHNLSRRVKPYLIAVGAPPTAHLHELRHTYATLLYQNGTPIDVVSSLLGHSSASMTYNFYVGDNNEARQAAADTLDNMFGRK